ncbi:MAG TPA: hypothetical protein VNT23_06685 [Gaiellaceae bacterium]|nr:hypothetical protein [Gaiellaceae bacterium]
MSALERSSRPSEAREAVAGFLASASLFVSLLGIAYRPARVIPVAIVLMLVAAVMTERHTRLVGWALGIAVVAWMVGMTIVVATDRPLY